jgi:Flp pilus assembly protein TadB
LNIIGSLLAAVSTAAAILASHPPSAVRRRLLMLAPPAIVRGRLRSVLTTRDLARSGLGWSDGDLVRAKLVGALTGAVVAATIALILPIGPLLVITATYAGFVLPTLYVERVAARRRADADQGLITLVEWAEALVASGRPVETALVSIAARGIGASLIDAALARASRSYSLGAPLFGALARESEAAGLAQLATIAAELERSRDLGRGALTVLRDERDRVRAAERAQGLAAAGQVETRLALVLVLCYLPALMLLVVIPLFLGLLDGLFV